MKTITNEINIFWLFIKSDIWATIIPGLTVSLSAIIFTNQIEFSPLLLVQSFLYFVLYVYTFTLSNQLISIDEDRVNKPYRPLASNLTSVKATKLRYILTVIVYISFSQLVGIVEWAIAWLVIQIFHNTYGHLHWFTKNVLSMTLGIFVLFGAGWSIVSSLGTDTLLWSGTISILFGVCGVIQDFRDRNGDKQLGRKTLILSLSEGRARLIGSTICLLSGITISTLMIYLNSQIYGIVLTTSTAIIFTYISYRIYFKKTEQQDHTSYMILLYTFNLVLFSSFIFLS